MATALTVSPPPPFFPRGASSHLPPPCRSLISLTQLKHFDGWRMKCTSSRPSQDTEPEADTSPSPSPAPSASTPSSPSSSSGDSAYSWSAALGGLGFCETAYLTYLKLTDSDAFCPAGGGSCGDVLNSDYAAVFGVPLPLIGMAAYGLVAALSLQLREKALPFGIGESNGRWILLGTTTSMAAASGYFLYILSTKLAGVTCAYCLASALLSFSLFFITLKDFELQEVQKQLSLQICIASLVIFTLNTSYADSRPISSSGAEINLPYVTTEVTTPSSPFALALARHLHSIGAKMYGAFWCSHCLEQKEMFGKEAYEVLDYVECFPDGYRKGTKIAKACADAKIEGFPTWVINGQVRNYSLQVLSGEQELPQLAEASGFKFNETSQPS
ncbi:hypothetical protein Tsubulata_004921 [Turnera subulata]|uniref:Vitamin K epoxide reductase domain-containing protein n=1 Tax=Turnera subulata TaxID=218843 RepID=A0A9Q0G492_9ROSI|nr:hypothetical protein Tsubulata_004921 [Turnera subulata]